MLHGLFAPIALLPLLLAASPVQELPCGSRSSGIEVPLELFDGLELGRANGVSFGDYDADGWIDIFVCQSGRLLRNVHGTSWVFAADLHEPGECPPADIPLPDIPLRYGSSFGDYDNDGLPDIATEPRTDGGGDGQFRLLKNVTSAFCDDFEDVAIEPQPPSGLKSETICWGDVEEDGDLDLFLPAYFAFHLPPQQSTSNFFLKNLGPTGPAGAYRMQVVAAGVGYSGLGNGMRPEGAQFVDLDDDGDMDLYSNGTLYRNQSESNPQFGKMAPTGSGITLQDQLDEGAAFFDYDLDGDFDLFIAYTNPQYGVRLWESRGDGTFIQGEDGIIEDPDCGNEIGLSAEDWDNDGDIDLTTEHVFRRNRMAEDGSRRFTVASHDIPAAHLTRAIPAWGDWDKDGDLDCAIGNYGNIALPAEGGHFYDNTLYDKSVPDDRKPYVRVRVVNDSPTVLRGLETAYGARVELVLHGDPFRRAKFVASSHGYLNQNEYALHFALPANPVAPIAGLVFDLVVDFPSRASRGVLRIDRHVNLGLGGIVLADLVQREITVFRSGAALIDGVRYEPQADVRSPRLFASGGGLAQPTDGEGLPSPLSAGPAEWVGVEFTTSSTSQILVKELVLDGQLAIPLPGTSFNVALWDVTDLQHPTRIAAQQASTSSRNRRTHFPFLMELAPDHTYRCVALVKRRRASTLHQETQVVHGLQVNGGLLFTDTDPSSGTAVTQASVNLSSIYLALRFVAAEDE